MHSFHYDSDLIGGSLQVRESRIVADLLLQDASPEQWHEVIQQQNRLQKRAPASAKRVAQAIRKRLERLDAPFWRQFEMEMMNSPLKWCSARPWSARTRFLSAAASPAKACSTPAGNSSSPAGGWWPMPSPCRRAASGLVRLLRTLQSRTPRSVDQERPAVVRLPVAGHR